MRIAVISTFPPMKCGIGIYTQRLVKAFIKQGHSVEVITELIHKKDDFSYYKKTASYLKKEKFDKVIIEHEYTFYNSIYFIIFLFMLQLKRIIVNIDMHTVGDSPSFLKRSLFWLYHQVMLLYINNLILHTREAERKIRKNILFGTKIIIIPLPIPINNVYSKPKNKSRYNILCFGFIDRIKGLDIACQAVEGLDCHLHIVGSVLPHFAEENKLYLQALIVMADKPNITLNIGFVSELEKAEYFKMADFILFPYRKVEQSAVLTEAFGFYKIPICSDLKPMKESIEDKYGILFKSENHIDLRARLKEIMGDYEGQLKISDNIKRLVDTNNFDSLAKRFIEVR